MQWISVKEELPDQDKQTDVIFYSTPYEFWAGVYTPKGFAGEPVGLFEYHQHWGDDQYHKVDDVTHWIKIPKIAVDAQKNY